MKFVRFERHGEAQFGVLENIDEVRLYEGDMYNAPQRTDVVVQLSEVKLLPPSVPGSMIALWNNSRQQIAELNRATPKEVLWFLKPPSSFITHGDKIVFPSGQSQRVVLEGEIGIVIGRNCKSITAVEAKNYIFGYTVVNDVTAQDIVQRDPSYAQYTRAKAFDTFGSFGPVIETEIDPINLQIESYLNGERCQNYPVADLVFDPFQIVAELSHTMTLHAGDVIACGTSLGVRPISKGDTIEIRIVGIGSLINTVE